MDLLPSCNQLVKSIGHNNYRDQPSASVRAQLINTLFIEKQLAHCILIKIMYTVGKVQKMINLAISLISLQIEYHLTYVVVHLPVSAEYSKFSLGLIKCVFSLLFFSETIFMPSAELSTEFMNASLSLCARCIKLFGFYLQPEQQSQGSEFGH